jgi:hypothetical protein
VGPIRNLVQRLPLRRPTFGILKVNEFARISFFEPEPVLVTWCYELLVTQANFSKLFVRNEYVFLDRGEMEEGLYYRPRGPVSLKFRFIDNNDLNSNCPYLNWKIIYIDGDSGEMKAMRFTFFGVRLLVMSFFDI